MRFIKRLLDCLRAQRTSETNKSTMDTRKSIDNQTDVHFSDNQTDVPLLLAKHLFFVSANDNFVFSPVSIHTVLGLIATGSGGPTLNQLLSFLNVKDIEELNSQLSQLVSLIFADGGPLGGPQLSFVNGVWVDRSLSLKASFKEIVNNAYKAAVTNVDFRSKAVEVTKEVNMWVEKETNGLIKEILPHSSVDSSTRLIFGNALYFKGAWEEAFDAADTKSDNFFLLNGSSVQVPFMTSDEKQYILAFSGFKVLRLPYKHAEDKRKFSMYIFLPDAQDGLPTLVEKVVSESGFLDHHLPYRSVKVGDFRIPKFKISFGFEASEVLKGLGVVFPFSGNGLTEMVDSSTCGNLCVSTILHKSVIEVNEEGTEATAATFGRMYPTSYERGLDFVADHPFLFVVREDTIGVLLFIGQIHNPEN